MSRTNYPTPLSPSSRRTGRTARHHHRAITNPRPSRNPAADPATRAGPSNKAPPKKVDKGKRRAYENDATGEAGPSSKRARPASPSIIVIEDDDEGEVKVEKVEESSDDDSVLVGLMLTSIAEALKDPKNRRRRSESEEQFVERLLERIAKDNQKKFLKLFRLFYTFEANFHPFTLEYQD